MPQLAVAILLAAAYDSCRIQDSVPRTRRSVQCYAIPNALQDIFIQIHEDDLDRLCDTEHVSPVVFEIIGSTVNWALSSQIFR